MKIFLVELNWNYEGFSIDSAWTTRELAEARKADLDAKERCCDSHDNVYIKEQTVTA